jgi:transcriptional regulator of acetoin/glycerol metabolism
MSAADIRPLADVERETIVHALVQTGHVERAAVRLGITGRTIYNKMRKYGITLEWIHQQRKLTFR